MTTALMKPEESTALATEGTAAERQLAGLRAFQLTTPEQRAALAAGLPKVKGAYARLEARLKEITGPMRAAEKAVRDLFRPPMDHYKAIEDEIKAKLAAWEKDVAAATEKAIEDATALAAAGDVAGAADALATIAEPTAKVEGVSMRKVWKAVVINVGLLDPALLLPNMPAINERMRASVKAYGAPEPMPGVKFVQEFETASRSET